MAVNRPGALRVFARLKLRLLANRLRGSSGQVVLFLGGVAVALSFTFAGFAIFIAPAFSDPEVWTLVSGFGGTGLVVGSVLLPLLWFGVDDTLDPARFALLPVPRWRMVAGLLVAALLSVPAAGLLVATTGLLVPAAVHGGVAAAVAQAVGVVAGMLLCVTAARAVVNAFASMLRSRRMRDLAGILLAVLGAAIGPAQLMLMSTVPNAELAQLARAAEVLGWTPLAAPYTLGLEVAAGRPWAVALKLVITLATVALLLGWWARSLESAMRGAVASGGPKVREAAGTSVGQLFPRPLRGLPASPFGAMVAREVRYWWRDARRRANLITIAVLGVLVPLMVTLFAPAHPANQAGREGTVEFSLSFSGEVSPLLLWSACVFVGAFAATVMANQFGFDATSYAAHLVIPVRGETELRARAVGYAVLVVPVLLVAGGVLAGLRGQPQDMLAAWGLLLVGFSAGMAVNMPLSVLAPYALPEGSNPFATASGSGMAKSFLAFLSLLVTFVVAGPALLTAHLLPQVWPWLAVPAGVGYGVAVVALSCYITGDLLEHRRPRLLAAITPKG